MVKVKLTERQGKECINRCARQLFSEHFKIRPGSACIVKTGKWSQATMFSLLFEGFEGFGPVYKQPAIDLRKSVSLDLESSEFMRFQHECQLFVSESTALAFWMDQQGTHSCPG